MLIPTIRTPARGVLPSSMGFKNAVFVNPGESLSTKYNWLKSSDRDAVMGAASATNRRTLILTTGKYTLSAAWTLDTDYIDIVGLSGNPKDSWITRPTGGSAVIQTADDVCLSNFTIETTGVSTGTDIGFEINATDNKPSHYQNMHFVGTAITTKTGLPVFGTSDMAGIWINCHATGFAWRVAATKELKAVMYDCISWYDNIGEYSSTNGYGYQSFGGDAETADCSGRFYRCITGFGGFGGCGTWGCNCSGIFIDCRSGNKSFSLQRQFTGYALRCLAGFNSFGAGSSFGGVNAKFGGTAIDCIVSGKGSGGIDTWVPEAYKSFGMGGTNSEGITANGKIINCQYGLNAELARGESRACDNTVASRGTKADLTTAYAGGVNNNVVLTAVKDGRDGNEITFVGASMPPANRFQVSGGDNIIIVTKGTNVKTAAELKTLMDAESDVTDIVSIAQAGDGTGNIEDTHATTKLSGGEDIPVIRGNHPPIPSAYDANAIIYYFDNGHTYMNEGASGEMTLTLPPALKGYKYHFRVVVAEELRIDPDGSETIAIDGTQQTAGKYITANAIGELCTLECVIAGQWEQTNALGTWTAEA